MYLGGVLALDILIRGVSFVFEGCSEDFCTFFFLYLSYIILLYIDLVTI